MADKSKMGLTEIHEMDRKQRRLEKGLPVPHRSLSDSGAVTGNYAPRRTGKFDVGIEAARTVALKTDCRKPITREQRDLRENIFTALSPKELAEDARIAAENARSYRQVDSLSERGQPAKGRLKDSERPRLYRALGSEERVATNAPIPQHTHGQSWQIGRRQTKTDTESLRPDQPLNESGRVQKTITDYPQRDRSYADSQDLRPIQRPDAWTDRQQAASLHSLDARYEAGAAQRERNTRRTK